MFWKKKITIVTQNGAHIRLRYRGTLRALDRAIENDKVVRFSEGGVLSGVRGSFITGYDVHK